ncbi:MAG TPA: SIS domain-containing protein [Anaerohalosphaeraceae bacterium]|jgi:D-sedoheptulose 7-phosphate isomerase|nr:SIS domain-containing protein [Anaerohalosphaeraceae bacterium]HRT52079.1 SIS domain-containing protein [Anaerohalosphaeraceae bacterium]HRT88144.1 SIS domain-containing protein [Anaerohalosphaeraceae bacterium]
MNRKVEQIVSTHERLVSEFRQHGILKVVDAAQMIGDCFRRGGCVYLCGNGGSAADCQHLAGEFVGRFRRNRAPLPAVALTTDTSVLTCIGNDFSFEDIFARQVEALAGPDDVLWAFSTSGTSKNVLAAAQAAERKGTKILAFTGRPGTPLEEMADVCLAVDAPTTAAAQEIHMLAYHALCELLDAALEGPFA